MFVIVYGPSPIFITNKCTVSLIEVDDKISYAEFLGSRSKLSEVISVLYDPLVSSFIIVQESVLNTRNLVPSDEAKAANLPLSLKVQH